MIGRFRPLFCLVVLILVGCGTRDDAPAESQDGSRIADDNVFSDQVRTLEKAEAVGRTLEDAAARQREQVERDSR